MATIIEMPKLSDTMSVGTLVKWHKKAGDSVQNGDILAEVETDKATVDYEAVDEGFLAKILIPAGCVRRRAPRACRAYPLLGRSCALSVSVGVLSLP